MSGAVTLDTKWRDKGVSDRTFDQVRARFGEQGVVDLVGINGYYTLLAMVMNVAGTPAATVPPIPLTADASR